MVYAALLAEFSVEAQMWVEWAVAATGCLVLVLVMDLEEVVEGVHIEVSVYQVLGRLKKEAYFQAHSE